MSERSTPQEPELRWEWVKYQLRLRGLTLADLARKLGVSGTAVKNTKWTPYPRMERVIAERLGRQPEDIWPERWNADGSPVRLRPRRLEVVRRDD